MVIYDSAAIFIESKKTQIDRVNAIQAIIDSLLTVAATAASNDNIQEYWLDNGQTRIKCIYKGADAVFQSIKGFEKLKNYYLNQINGRRMTLVDSKNLSGNGSFR